MRFFIADVKKYRRYAWYSAISELKGQVAGSKLGWIWWILEPLCFMLIYAFIYTCVFKRNKENLAIFIFIGITFWNYFTRSIMGSTNIISAFAGVTRKVFIPKFILIWMRMFEFLVKMFISIGIIFVALIVLKIQITIQYVWLLPILISYTLLIYGLSAFCAYLGVFISDLSHIMTIALRMLFYLSGVFYSTEVLTGTLGAIYPFLCPSGFFIGQMRDIIMYGATIHVLPMIEWTVVGILLSIYGTKLLYYGEKDYLKVV